MIKTQINIERIESSPVMSLSIGRSIIVDNNWNPDGSENVIKFKDLFEHVKKRPRTENEFFVMDGMFKFKNDVTTIPHAEEGKTYPEIVSGDFMIPQIAPWDSRVVIDRKDLIGVGTSGDIHEFKFIGDDRNYIYWAWTIMISDKYRGMMKNLTTGKTHPRVKEYDFLEINLPIPTTDELKNIKKQVTDLWKELGTIEKRKEAIITSFTER